jgi:acyl carrier protein
MDNMQERIILLMTDALMGENVNVDSTVDNLAGWDSLGHLSILSALDEASGGKINQISNFNDVKSVKEIIDLCELHNIKF